MTLDPNIKLVKFTSSDFLNYFELVRNEKVMKMITGKPYTRKKAEVNFQRLIENNRFHKDLGTFKILHADTDEFLGYAKLTLEKSESREAELGYMLLPEHWGKGIAGKAARLLTQKARACKTLDGLFAIIDPKNLSSKKILTNNGFTTKGFKDFDGLPGEILKLQL